MSYLLDTNAWIHYLNPGDSPIKHKIRTIPPSQIFLCSVVKAELYFGAYKSSRRDANLSLLEKLFTQFACLPFDGQTARVFGEIRANLAAKGNPIGPYDLQIAAIALGHGLILVTHNVQEFSRVPGLVLEDWQT